MPEPIRVIYVDDDPDLLEIGNIFLEKTGEFIVTIAESAEDAISVFREQSFDAIISDYQMPGMDGIEFLKHLRSSKDTTPFIIFTGKGREDVVIQALNEGADFYLQKGGETKSQFAELSNKIRYAVSRRQGEKRLLESEERYKNVVETQSEFICRFLPDGTHLFVNEAYCRRFNTNPQEIIGTRFKPVIHTDDRDAVSCLFASLTPNHPIGTIEQRTILPDRGVVWDRWSTRAFFNEDGTVREYQSVGSDITELVEREQMIRKSEERFQKVMNLVPDMISIHDPEMTILYSNWMGFGAVPEEKRQVLTKCYRTYRDLDDICPDCQAKEVISSKNPFEREVLLPDGRWFDLRVIPAETSEGDVEYFLEWVRDITERKITESKAIESSRLLKGMLDGITDIIGLQLPDHTILQYNKAGYDILGLTPQEVLGRTCYELIGRSIPCENCATSLAVASKKPETLVKYIPKFGKYFECTSNPIIDENGEIEMIIERLFDITDRKQVEEDLFQNRTMLHEVLNAIPQSVFWKDRDCRYLGCNMQFAQAVGLQDPDLIVGKTDFDLPWPQEEADSYRADDRFVMDCNSPRSHIIEPLQQADSSRLWIDTTKVPLTDGQGNVYGVLGIYEDVTERKGILEALAESESFNRGLIENLPDYVSVYGMDGKLLYVNPASAKALGYDADTLIGMHILSFIAEEYHETVIANIIARKEGEEVPPYELELVARNGARRSVIVKAAPIQYQNNPATLLLLIDITDRKAVEATLRQSEAEFRDLFNNAGDAIVIHDMEGRFLAVNDEICRRLGYTRQELLGLHPWDIDEPNFGTKAKDQIATLRQTGHTVFETVHLAKDGTRIPVEVSSRLITYHGKPAIISTARDITDRKAAEGALRESEEKYHLIAENTADHIWIFDMDLTMTYSSPSVTRMKGFTVEETLSQSFEEMMTPGSFEMALKRFHEEMAQEAAGTADPDRTISLETEEYCKDGRIIIVENVATLLRDCAQKPVGILGVSRDITDRKKAEEALRESEERFRVAQEMSPDGFTILHPMRNKKGEIIDFKWIYENQTIARLNKTDPQEVIGKRLLDLFPGHIGTSVFQAYINAANTGIPQIIEEISVSEIFSNPTWLRLVIISMGEDIAILAQDITNRKTTEQALREVNKKLNILSSITRHDINNQLSIVLGSLDLLEENADRKDIESITMASAAAKRISSMIQFTREYEMIGVNTPVWHDLKNLIESVAGKVHLGSIRAVCIIPAGLLIYADPLITTVFYNIIENAVRYGEKISEIRLFSRQSGDEIIIVCEDDGNGISDGQKEKIFEKGFGKNTGMGLFLSREILSITGISIRETGTYGEGARFLITVPDGKWQNKRERD